METFEELTKELNTENKSVQQLREAALAIIRQLTDHIYELENGYILDLEEELEEKTQQLLDFQNNCKNTEKLIMLYDKSIKENERLSSNLEKCLAASRRLTETLKQQRAIMEEEE